MYGKSTEQEEFDSNLEANVKLIKANLDKTSDPKFARNLCIWYERYESFSSKQSFRAMKFWQEINSQDPDAAASNVVNLTKGREVLLPAQVGVDGKKMHEALLLAGAKLSFPRIKYKLENDGGHLLFHLLGDRSRHPGNMVVKFQQHGFSFADAQLMAERYVKLDKFVFTSLALANFKMQELIQKVVDSFPEELAINGREHICCCFCGIELTADASRKAGYGPICASNYGLSWGEPEPLIGLGDIT